MRIPLFAARIAAPFVVPFVALDALVGRVFAEYPADAPARDNRGLRDFVWVYAAACAVAAVAVAVLAWDFDERPEPQPVDTVVIVIPDPPRG